MRDFIRIISEAIEKVTTHTGKDVVTLRNPSMREVHALVARAPHNEVRWMLTEPNGDLYTWAAYDANHDEIAHLLAVEYDEHGWIGPGMKDYGMAPERYTVNQFAVYRDPGPPMGSYSNYEMAFPRRPSPFPAMVEGFSFLRSIAEHEMVDPMAVRRMGVPAFHAPFDQGRQNGAVWHNPRPNTIEMIIRESRGDARALIGAMDFYSWPDMDMTHDDVRAFLGQEGTSLYSATIYRDRIAIKGRGWDDDEFEEEVVGIIRSNPTVRRAYGMAAKVEQQTWSW